ncbi:hypothetical protein L3X38_004410 [Prunus dulcis]|uniref:Uncharacterized protein n=1 Tax=Prunus dulcis TaxID=3755 RepID=A0AAD4ZNX6_PRUDU|nr:hypothetical protein L3X38_004410 [Prunus dulcis]
MHRHTGRHSVGVPSDNASLENLNISGKDFYPSGDQVGLEEEVTMVLLGPVPTKMAAGHGDGKEKIDRLF